MTGRERPSTSTMIRPRILEGNTADRGQQIDTYGREADLSAMRRECMSADDEKLSARREQRGQHLGEVSVHSNGHP